MPRRVKNRKQVKASVTVSLAGMFDGVAADDLGPKWVQVTREGNFPGYMGGLKPFAFTRPDLEAMVANLQAHQSFAAGDDGVGTNNVIPWDFNHASEANPTAGNLPAEGAPSQGWTLDMKIRNGADGKAELWALTNFLEPARGYVKAERYQWASVAVTFNAIQPETGQNVGALVTSIALTNTPFVEGMQRLVASKQGGGEPVEARRTWFEAARDVGEAIGMMREMFALPETAGAAEVMAQVGIVAQWIASGTAPLGTNPEELIGNMRIILNLPALSSQMTVLEEAGKSIQALLEEESTGGGLPAPDNGLVPEPPDTDDIAAARRKESEMELDKLIQALASALGVRENETAILSACKELGDLRTALVAEFDLTRDGNAVILAAAKDGAGAKEKLLGLFGALGVEDADAALAKVASTIESAGKLLEVMPELEGLKAEAKKVEEESIESDVDSAIAASKLPVEMKDALLLQRTSDPEGFAKSFPKPAAGAPRARPDLTRRVAASGSTPLRSDGTKVSLGAQPTDAEADPIPDQVGGKDSVNLALMGGPNPTACAKLHLAANHSGWDKLSLEQQHTMACNFKKQSHVFHQAVAS